MNPEHNRERRLARAKALVDLHANDSGAAYVDAAKHHGGGDRGDDGNTKTAASIRVGKPHQAEEVAVALAITDFLRKAEANGSSGSGVIRWFPAHMGKTVAGQVGNANHETANAVARGLASRVTTTSQADSDDVVAGNDDDGTEDTMTSYNDVVK